MQTTEGIFHDIDSAIYHKSPGVSNSMLKHLKRSPAHLQTAIAQPDEQTDAMLFGSIVHQIILEPAKPAFWVVRPEGLDGRTAAGKAWAAQAGNKPVLSNEDWLRVTGVTNAVLTHPTASRALASGKSEVSVYKNFSLGGTVMRRARIDFVNDGNALVDIKTTVDARPEEFAKQAYNLSYHMQAAYYLDIYNDALPEGETRKDSFVFIAVEKEAPFAISVLDLDQDDINEGRREYIKLLQLYIECERQGSWPAYCPDVQTLKLPTWARKKGAQLF